MAVLYRKITKRFVVLSNIVLAVFFLLASLALYFDPVTYWFIAFLGFAFPYLCLVVIFFLLIWIFFKSNWALLNIGLLLVSWQSIQAVFAFHPFSKKFQQEKQEGSIRIMQWNSMCFGENLDDRIRGSEIREDMLKYIKENDVDILCLEEFYDSDLPQFNNNIKYIRDVLGYPNFTYTKDYVRQIKNNSGTYDNIGYLGTAIFSKLQIADSGRIAFATNDQKNKEAIAYLDVVKNKDTIRVLAAHLQSIHLKKDDYDEVYKLKDASQSGLQGTKNVFSKIKRAYRYRRGQANLFKLQIEASPYPVLVAADCNDIPNSYTYATIKNNLQDVFIKKGFGIGRTFSAIAPTLRIDYLLADKQFKVLQVKKENKRLSDHYPIIADVILQQ